MSSNCSAKAPCSVLPVQSRKQRLAEYRLIASYRDRSRASVDDFHDMFVLPGADRWIAFTLKETSNHDKLRAGELRNWPY